MNSVKHLGYVEKIAGNNYIIKIISKSACVSCHAKDACPASDLKEKLLAFPICQCRKLSIGEEIEISISNKNGEQAYIIAYTIPVFLIIMSVIILKTLEVSQGISAVVILAIMTLYFLGLYFFKNKIAKKIKIKII